MTNQGSGAGLDPATSTTGAPGDSPPVGRIVLVAATAALGGFLFGFDTAVINGAVGAIREWSHVGATLLGFSVVAGPHL
jgi:SP family sugar:H+ symporter-like MFS transporter